MIVSDELFKLIKSLTKSEKRYFQLFSKLQSGNKAYQKLFEAIEKQSRQPSEEYDEEKLKRALKKEPFIERLAIEKVLLYKQILKSLEFYHSRDPEYKIQNQLRHVKILMQKGLYDQSKKILEKLKEYAKQQEDFMSLFELLGWEVVLMKNMSSGEKAENDLDALLHESYRLLDQAKNVRQYQINANKIGILNQKDGLSRSPLQASKLTEILQQPFFQSEEQALSNKALYNYYQCHLLYYGQTHDYKSLSVYCQKIVALMERTPVLTRHASYYVSALWDALISLILLRQFDQMPAYIKKLREVSLSGKDVSDRLKNMIEQSSSYMELEMYIGMARFDNAIEQIAKTERIIEKYELQLTKPDQINLTYYSGYAYFCKGEYSLAKKYFNRILDNAHEYAKADVLAIAKIVTLIIYFEQKDGDLLDYAVKSAYRFLSKIEKIYKVESIILDFIKRKVPKIKTEKELLDAFVKLRGELIDIFKDPFEAKVLGHFDFISWLDSKIENRPFEEVLKEKAADNRTSGQ